MKTIFALVLLSLSYGCFTTDSTPENRAPFQWKTADRSQVTDRDGKIYYTFDVPTDTKVELKINDKFDVLSSSGESYSFVVFKNTTKIENNLSRISAITDSKFDEVWSKYDTDFYVANVGAKLNLPSEKEEKTEPKNEVKFNAYAIIDGKEWMGGAFFNSALFYAKGLEAMGSKNKPYLQIAFQTIQVPGDRQLTITASDFKGIGIPSDYSVLLSGSATNNSDDVQMQGYELKPSGPKPKTDFTFEVTRWEKLSNGNFMIDAKFSGTLRGQLLSKDCVISDGYIKGMEVKTFHEAY